MPAYSSTVLALPQMKSECPAAEALCQKAPLWCEKKLRILFRSGRYAYVKSAPNCIISTRKKSKTFCGEGGVQGGGVPSIDPAPTGEGTPLPRPYPPRHLRRLESATAARPRRLLPLESRPYPHSEILHPPLKRMQKLNVNSQSYSVLSVVVAKSLLISLTKWCMHQCMFYRATQSRRQHFTFLACNKFEMNESTIFFMIFGTYYKLHKATNEMVFTL